MVEGEIIAVVIEPASQEMGWTGSMASAAMMASAISAGVAGLEMELVAIDDKDFELAMALVEVFTAPHVNPLDSTGFLWTSVDSKSNLFVWYSIQFLGIGLDWSPV